MSDPRRVWGHSRRLLRPLVIPWAKGFYLAVPPEGPAAAGGFPTSRISRGLLLCHRDLDLCEEGVGFGVPVLMQGLVSIFPGNRRCRWSARGRVMEVTLDYEMNLAERLSRAGKSVGSPIVYAGHRLAAAVHRSLPVMRGVLTRLSSLMRGTLSIRTSYREVPSEGTCSVHYAIEPRDSFCMISVRVTARGLRREGLSEIVIMNELGARAFDRYEDSDGIRLDGGAIGTWNEVTAQHAVMDCRRAGVSFALERRSGARLMRGRELVDDRLAWSGFAYRLPPGSDGLEYDIRLARHA